MDLVRTDASCVRPMGYSAIFFCVFSSVLLASLRLCPSEVRKYSSVPQLFVFFATPRVPQLFVLGNVLICLRIPTIKYISAKSRPPCCSRDLFLGYVRYYSLRYNCEKGENRDITLRIVPTVARKRGKSTYFPSYCSYCSSSFSSLRS